MNKEKLELILLDKLRYLLCFCCKDRSCYGDCHECDHYAVSEEDYLNSCREIIERYGE